MPRFKKGDKVQMTADALENYGEQYAGMTLTVAHISDRYMPASIFFARGQPEGYHPGYDGQGEALYDLDGIEFSLYEWELEPDQC